jgi:coenzyme F420 hydrogenase subunit beta
MEIVTGKAVFDVPRRQSGGAVTAILVNALEEGLIDAVVTVTADPWTLRPSSAVITRTEALVQSAGSRYNWWVPLLAALKHAVVEKKYRKIAVVGVPCAVQALARIRGSDNDLLKPFASAIRLVIGLFCTETFDYMALVEGKLKGELGIAPNEIKKLDVKGKLEIRKQDGSTTNVPLAELENCIRKGCHICTDLTAVFSDISAGAVGSPAGSTTLVIRTPAGKGFVDSAVRANKLATASGVDEAAIRKLAATKIRKNSKA